jgi:hypothetical protein
VRMGGLLSTGSEPRAGGEVLCHEVLLADVAASVTGGRAHDVTGTLKETLDDRGEIRHGDPPKNTGIL